MDSRIDENCRIHLQMPLTIFNQAIAMMLAATLVLAVNLVQHWEKPLQILKRMMSSEAFLKVNQWKNVVEKKLKKIMSDVIKRFKILDMWGRASCFFLALTWIAWSVASLNSLPPHYNMIYNVLIQCPLIVLVFPTLLLLVYLLQSVMFVSILQSPLMRLFGHVGIGILQEIIYPIVKENPPLIFAFAFYHTALILQYTCYCGLHHRLTPADSWEKKEVVVEMVALHLLRLLVRTLFIGRILETGAFMMPFLVGIFAIHHLSNVTWHFNRQDSRVNQIQSPQVQVSDSNGDDANNLEEEEEGDGAINKLEEEEEGDSDSYVVVESSDV